MNSSSSHESLSQLQNLLQSIQSSRSIVEKLCSEINERIVALGDNTVDKYLSRVLEQLKIRCDAVLGTFDLFDAKNLGDIISWYTDLETALQELVWPFDEVNEYFAPDVVEDVRKNVLDAIMDTIVASKQCVDDNVNKLLTKLKYEASIYGIDPQKSELLQVITMLEEAVREAETAVELREKGSAWFSSVWSSIQRAAKAMYIYNKIADKYIEVYDTVESIIRLLPYIITCPKTKTATP